MIFNVISRAKRELKASLTLFKKIFEGFFTRARVREMLEQAGIDTKKVKIVDIAKYLIKYFPDVIEELATKYGDIHTIIKEEKIEQEAMDLVQEKILDDLSKMPVKSWNIYYFLRYCILYEPMVLAENIKIIPFNGWPSNDYLEIVTRIMNNLGPPASAYSEKKFNKFKEYIRKHYSEKNSISLLIFEDVSASDENDIYQKTAHQLENIILILSNLTNSSIEIGGWVIEGTKDSFKELRPTVYFPIYKPTRARGGRRFSGLDTFEIVKHLREREWSNEKSPTSGDGSSTRD